MKESFRGVCSLYLGLASARIWDSVSCGSRVSGWLTMIIGYLRFFEDCILRFNLCVQRSNWLYWSFWTICTRRLEDKLSAAQFRISLLYIVHPKNCAKITQSCFCLLIFVDCWLALDWYNALLINGYWLWEFICHSVGVKSSQVNPHYRWNSVC